MDNETEPQGNSSMESQETSLSCNDATNTIMMNCEGCEQLCHLKCSGLDSSPEKRKCGRCQCESSAHNIASEPVNPNESDQHSTSSHLSRQSSSSMARMKLHRLEQERALQLRHSKEQEELEEHQASEREKRAKAREEARLAREAEDEKRALERDAARRARKDREAEAEKAYLAQRNVLVEQVESSSRVSSVRSWVDSFEMFQNTNSASQTTNCITTSAQMVLTTSVSSSQSCSITYSQNGARSASNVAPSIYCATPNVVTNCAPTGSHPSLTSNASSSSFYAPPSLPNIAPTSFYPALTSNASSSSFYAPPSVANIAPTSFYPALTRNASSSSFYAPPSVANSAPTSFYPALTSNASSSSFFCAQPNVTDRAPTAFFTSLANNYNSSTFCAPLNDTYFVPPSFYPPSTCNSYLFAPQNGLYSAPPAFNLPHGPSVVLGTRVTQTGTTINSAPSGYIASALNNAPSLQQTFVTTPSAQFGPHNPVLINAPPPRAPINQDRLLQSHIAARQSMSKDLPTFSGSPEEWPIFIANYELSNQLCAYRDGENLLRLQRALKGKALEAVRCQLLLPENVPDVIQTLQTMFGNPEILIYNVLQKIRSEPTPRDDKFESIVNYSLSIKNIVCTMRASRIENHLSNPMLLQELIERLPSSLRLQWGMFVQQTQASSLVAFSAWLSNIASAVNNVNKITPFKDSLESKTKTTKSKGLFLHSSEEPSTTGQADDKKPASPSKTCERKSSTPKTPFSCIACNSTNYHHLETCSSFKSSTRSERWSLLRKHHFCYRCLKKHTNKCSVEKVCGIDGCKYKHHSLLHNSTSNGSPKSKSVPVSNNAVNTHHENDQQCFYRIVPVTLSGPNISIETFAFLDGGSSLTMIEDELANTLQLTGPQEDLCLRWTGETARVEKGSKRVSLRIAGQHKGSKTFSLFNVRTMKNLNLGSQTVSREMLNKYSHLKNLPIKPYHNAKPTILIGLDNEKIRVPLKRQKSKWHHPIATKTRLGWMVQGHAKPDNCISNNQIQVHKCLHICHCHSDGDLHDQVKQYFSLENFGIRHSDIVHESKEDQRARNILTKTTVKDEQGFTTGLLWRFDDFKLPNSYIMAKHRLMCLERKMQKDPVMAQNMCQKIAEYVNKGYARQLTSAESNDSSSTDRTWYLPIFPVTNANKPGKLRIVWDAAATVNGVSLNSFLLKGPDQLSSLTAVLCRFRERKIAICGDIREMYHQVRIRHLDQNAQRFLWRDGDTSREPNVYVMQVMTFGASCSPSIAHYIKDRNAKENMDYSPRAGKAIIENHYVDDFLDSMETIDETIELAKAVRTIHKRGGFEIRNWLSNSPEVLQALNVPIKPSLIDPITPILNEPVAPTLNKNLELGTDIVTSKVLGMFWRTSDDTFTYSLVNNKSGQSILNGEQRPTKREVLRTMMSIFDSLGLLANCLIYIKILLQEVWRSNIAWDEPIADNEFQRWLIWVKHLPLVEEISIPRCLVANMASVQSIQLHTFVDASENAYAAVCYFRILYQSNVECKLIAAKTRVAPQKPLSIPRMELQAAVLGARLAATVTSSHTLQISQHVYWSDSRNVLCWIRSDLRKYRQFVAFRIGEILETTEIQQWRWIPSKDNVADEATKWKTQPEINSSSRWFLGPSFLQKSENQWPIENTTNVVNICEELRPVMVHRECKHHPIIEYNRFSKWKRLLRTQAYVLRFIENSKALTTSKSHGEITQSEYLQAETKIFQQVQREMFEDEIQILQKNKNATTVPRKIIPRTSILHDRSPYLDENNVLRVRGRIDAAQHIADQMKRPVILPKAHIVTSLIVKFYHEKYHHQNHQTALNELQKRFSIPSLRTNMNSIRRDCQQCKNDRAKPQPPEMGDLPYALLSAFTRPFTFVGVDYFGPIQVSIGRRIEKRWCAIFTCLTIRAVHLELAHSLSTDSFILCYRNFIARRGTPREIYSDNGTNFRGADAELRKELQKIDFKKMERCFVASDLKWNFNPPAAPHMGGAWERLVRSIKRTLTASMPTSRTPPEELLRSFLLEAENVVNSRPLTYVSLNTSDEEAITPNHFLIGTSDGSKPAGLFSDDDLILRTNWKVSQTLADHFWRRWISEYLPTLTRRTKWFTPVDPVKKGDVVIIVDPDNPRNSWPKGIVLETTPGSNNQVRRAIVQTSSGIFSRPATKLAVLDLRHET